ncbi:MAG: RHS repeat-associated core domain-containing protein [Saprospiraceae bacterium]
MGWKKYEVTNYLGNVLSVLSDRKKPKSISSGMATSYDPVIISAMDYYPFGLEMEGRTADFENYRYGYNGKEALRNNEWGSQTHYDYGFRIYNPGLGRFLSVDPLAAEFPSWSSYSYTFNNPIRFIDPDGRAPDDVIVGFTGGFQGGGKKLDLANAGTTGKIIQAAQQAVQSKIIEFSGAVYAPGVSVNGAVSNAFDFIKSNYTKGEKVIVYGYSYGGDAAVELTLKLQEAGISVDLLITVDAADGPMMGMTTNREIPNNVSSNLNEFQTTNSVIGSRGDANTSSNPLTVKNIDVGEMVKGVTHENIDEVTTNFNIYHINSLITGQPGEAPRFSNPKINSGSSKSSSESSSGSSSGTSSSSSFNEKY